MREFPVLVVGAGPAGLSAAITLAHYGVDSLLVERRVAPSPHPRATVVTTRSMELVRAWGLEEQVLSGGVEVDWLMWYCDTLARADRGFGVEVGLPTRSQAALVSPVAPECVPQDHLERVLLAHLSARDAARVELGTELVGLEQRPHAVHAVLRSAAGDERVRAGYVVAADGAYSTVRRALGVPMHGPADVLTATQALLRAPLWATVGERRYGLYWTEHPSAQGLFLPAGRDDRWGFGYFRDPSDPSLPTPEEMTRRVRLAAGVPDLPVRIEQIASFSSAAQVAERFRDGSVFLAGDAAHRLTPRGGTGMNTALHDGYDLGWKLAWVLRGWAGDRLLDSYERERRPVAEHNVARSADPDGSRRAADEGLRADLGGRLPHHWVTTPSGRVSTLDLLGSGLTLLTGPEVERWRGAARVAAGGPPVVHHSLDAISARALGMRREGAMLVRPDGIPAGWWSADAGPRALAEAIAGVGASRETGEVGADAA